MPRSSTVAAQAALIFSTLLLSVSTANSWTQSQFAIATFVDPRLSCETGTCGSDSVGDVLRFQLPKTAYFNLLTGIQNNIDDYRANCISPPDCPSGYVKCPSNPNLCVPCIMSPSRVDNSTLGQKYAIRIAQRAGIRYFVVDHLLWKQPFLTTGQCGGPPPCPYPDPIGTVTNQYIFLPVPTLSYLYGFNYWDEVPWESATGFLHYYVRKSIYRFQHATSAPCLTSFFPYYECFPNQPTQDQCTVKFASKADYETYLNQYLAPTDESTQESPTNIVAFDNYPFTTYGVRQTYFYNLSVIRHKAGNIPVWAHVMTTPHGNTSFNGVYYTDPTAGQLRFMGFCPVAYGAKGLFYFSYELPIDSPCQTTYWHGPALVDDNGNPVQPKFDYVKAINRYITYTLAPVVMTHAFLGAFHVGAAPTGEAPPVGETLSGSAVLVAASNQSLLFGLFEDGGGGYYIIVVNKDWSAAANNVTVAVRGSRSGSLSVASGDPTGGQGVGYATVDGAYDASQDATTFGIGSLDPGGAVVLRVGGTGGGTCVPSPCRAEPALDPHHLGDAFGRVLVEPSPSHGSTTFGLADTRDRLATIRLFDLAGRSVGELRAAPPRSGPSRVTWDGRDTEGNPVRAGVYVYVSRTTRGMLSGQFSLVR